MSQSTPSYLTKDFLKRTLINGLKMSNIEVKDFIVSSASGKGENFTSELLRVCVNYKLCQQENQQISLIMKNVILSDVLSNTFNHKDVVQIEINMYTKIIPEIENLLGNSIMLAPRCLLADEQANILVLEDLNSLGYEVKNRITGLDEAHCILVMKKIAQLHAGSMQIVKTKPKTIEIYNPMFNESQFDQFRKLFVKNFERMVTFVKDWPGFESIVKKLENISKNLIEKGVKQQKKGQLRVISHGDLWVNNIMFKYSKDRQAPSDVAFIDLQMSYYGSLASDLHYFFVTSPQLEVLKSKRTDFLKVYYEMLKSTLGQLKYSPIPSWEEFRKEMRIKEFSALITLGCIFPVVAMDKSASHDSTAESLLKDSPEKLNAMFGSERMIETLKYFLKRFDELGVLDE